MPCGYIKEKKKKMTKRICSVTIDNEIKNEIVLVDDIWGVIGSLIPWYDIDTLVRFAMLFAGYKLA